MGRDDSDKAYTPIQQLVKIGGQPSGHRPRTVSIQARADGSTEDGTEIQEELNRIGHRIRETEKASPSGIFSEYK